MSGIFKGVMENSALVFLCLLIHLNSLTYCYTPHPRPGFPNRFPIDPRNLPLSCLEQQQELPTAEANTVSMTISEDSVEEVNKTAQPIIV